MQKLIILRGTPASGKSTIAKSYRNFEDKVVWLKVDNFKDFFADDASKALDFVNGSALATLEYLLKEGFSVVMEGVFQNTKPITEGVIIAKKLNIPAKVFELDVPLEELIKRDQKREGVQEGLRRQLPAEVITRIYTILKENPYPDAIKLDTVSYSVDKCKELIESAFS